MVISRRPTRYKVVINDTRIEQVSKLNYLGAQVSSGNFYDEVQTQVMKAAKVSECLRDVVWNNKYMSKDCKTRIYKNYIRPILTHSVETRAETTKTKNRLQVAEMKVLRSISGLSLRDKIRNENIRKQCGIIDILKWTKGRCRWEARLTSPTYCPNQPQIDLLEDLQKDGLTVGKTGNKQEKS